MWAEMPASSKARKKAAPWAEINLAALSYNYNLVKRFAGNAKIFPVVKADGYGHGAEEVSKLFAGKHGAQALGVARVSEGVELRRAGIRAPVIILGGFHTDEAGEIIEYGLEPSVYGMNEARALSREACRKKRFVPVHIKINTGMNRLGVSYKDGDGFICGVM
ncbi:MAG TPA: hypothetical protein ENN43_08965, partial [bacterium]|nr:hypothetical protein [bacterium]